MPERLDYIIAIVEEQNITRAAKRLYITQPALTKYINKLEEEYGICLFDRKNSPVTLTEAGKLFLEEKTRIEVAEQNLRHRLELLKNRSWKRQGQCLGSKAVTGILPETSRY